MNRRNFVQTIVALVAVGLLAPACTTATAEPETWSASSGRQARIAHEERLRALRPRYRRLRRGPDQRNEAVRSKPRRFRRRHPAEPGSIELQLAPAN